MDQESAMMIFLSYQKLRMPTFSKIRWMHSSPAETTFLVYAFLGVRQRQTENPLRERLLVRKFIAQLET